jgi:peroxiredoxin
MSTDNVSVDNPVSADTVAAAKAKRRNLIILLAALAILLNGLFNFFTSQGNSHNEMIKIGARFPNFSIKQLDDRIVTADEFKGKPTIYFFFANWCPCSHASVELVKKAIADNARHGVALCSIGIQDTPEELAKFIKKHNMPPPVGVSGGKEMADQLGIRTTPTTLFVDANGVVRHIFIGKIERYEQIGNGVISITGKATA